MPDNGPVLLPNIGLVVLLVGATAGKDQMFLLAIAHQVGVEKLDPIVRIDAQEGKRQACPRSHNGVIAIARMAL